MVVRGAEQKHKTCHSEPDRKHSCDLELMMLWQTSWQQAITALMTKD